MSEVLTELTVNGMTCGHCVAAVREELSAVVGVTSVDVDLASGAVVVHSDAELSPEDIRSAIDEAGYELVT